MQQYRVRLYSRVEGTEWKPVNHTVFTTLQDLENAMRDKYHHGTQRGYVTKIPQLPISFHALMLDHNQRWDCINGFT